MPESAPASALARFAEAVGGKFATTVPGNPEAQLTGPVETPPSALAPAGAAAVVFTGETAAADLGRPDLAAHRGGLLLGHVELKAPGKGANPAKFPKNSHDRDQWDRFKNLPNLLYTDGNAWALYRDGDRVGKVVRLPGDVRTDGADAAGQDEAARGSVAGKLAGLVEQFYDWRPTVPYSGRKLAEALAPRCRLLRDAVADAMTADGSPLHRLADEWRYDLFPDADDDRFADGYAQTVTFALLLARAAGADVTNLHAAVAALESEHALLARALQLLTDRKARAEIAVALETLQRTVDAVDPAKLAAGPGMKSAGAKGERAADADPWLYFYEDFLAEYDAKMRRDYGVYYTPVEVVRCQVRLLDDLLRAELNRPAGFSEPGVVTLDPAAGTGTYPLAVIDHALDRAEDLEGPGAVAGHAATLAKQVFAFEWMVGPYAVAELRLSQELRRRGADVPPEGPPIFLHNTLGSPFAVPPIGSLFESVLTGENRRALELKRQTDVLVCLGNPPYDRHDAATDDSDAGAIGAWVRFGDPDDPDAAPILNDVLEAAKAAGHGGDLKNAYNLYVYFWRWALWKVFQFDEGRGESGATTPGLVSFITASSYLTGTAFVGLRELMRKECDAIYILDLGGEGRGTRKEPNVFAIQTPVCVAVCVRSGAPDRKRPAKVKISPRAGRRPRRQARRAGRDWNTRRRAVEGLPRRLARPVHAGRRGPVLQYAASDGDVSLAAERLQNAANLANRP